VAKRRKTPRAAKEESRAAWRIHFFQRHAADDPSRAVPARDFLERCPVAPRMAAILKAVAEAPPHAFAGGGYWEAMHGKMGGYYEVRVDGPNRIHYRLFCVLEHDGEHLGLGGPSIVVITGMEKAFQTTFSERDYERVRQLGEEYQSRFPRSVLR